MNSKYKILSLDGGGSWALIQAKCLLKMHGNIKGRELLKKFDLVVANSGGSLVAAAMADDKTLSEVCDLITNESSRSLVFYKLSFFHSLIQRLFGIGPKYSSAKKLEGLKKLLPECSKKTLVDLAKEINSKRIDGRQTHFLISTFDYDRDRTSFMRSDLSSKATSSSIAGKPPASSSVTLTQAVHAASNAPVNYFDKPAMFPLTNGGEIRYFWDGAVGGYNNPVVAGVAEALINGRHADDIAVLSIGTGNVMLPLKLDINSPANATSPVLLQGRKNPTLINDVRELTTSILAEPPETALFVAYTMLYPQLLPLRNCFVRMNPLVQPILEGNIWDLPSTINEKEFNRLAHLDMDATKQEDVELIERFCNAWLDDHVPNQPIRYGEKFNCLIGHPRFSLAWKDWQKCY